MHICAQATVHKVGAVICSSESALCCFVVHEHEMKAESKPFAAQLQRACGLAMHQRTHLRPKTLVVSQVLKPAYANKTHTRRGDTFHSTPAQRYVG